MSPLCQTSDKYSAFHDVTLDLWPMEMASAEITVENWTVNICLLEYYDIFQHKQLFLEFSEHYNFKLNPKLSVSKNSPGYTKSVNYCSGF